MRNLYKFIFIYMLLAMSSFASDYNSYKVKKGFLYYNPTISIEEAFDNYQYFDETIWESIEENGLIGVQAISQLNEEYLFNYATDWVSEFKGTFIVQFILIDNAIVPDGIGLIYTDKKTNKIMEEKYTPDYNLNHKGIFEILESIYDNEPLKHIYN